MTKSIRRILSIIIVAVSLTSCASGYKNIDPTTINYVSRNLDNNILFEYKHDLLHKKYKKKEEKNKIKLIAVKVTNNTENDIVFGQDVKLILENGSELLPIERETLYKKIKQSPASHLFYLLLSPVQLYSGTKTSSDGFTTEPANTFPIGLIVGPGIAGTNMLVASSANKKFKTELLQYDIYGRTIAKGQTAYGIIGLYTSSYEAIKLQVK